MVFYLNGGVLAPATSISGKDAGEEAFHMTVGRHSIPK